MADSLKKFFARLIVGPWKKLAIIVSPILGKVLERLADWFLGDAVVSGVKERIGEIRVLHWLSIVLNLALRYPYDLPHT